jgi:hypothetical protein
VSNAFDCDEVHAIILLVVARDLVAIDSIYSLPLSPCLGHRPIKILDPLLGTVGWNCSISITRVMHHSYLILQESVDPLRGLRLSGVLPIRIDIFINTLCKSSYRGGNVESCPNILVLKECCNSGGVITIGFFSWIYLEGIGWDSPEIILESFVDFTKFGVHVMTTRAEIQIICLSIPVKIIEIQSRSHVLHLIIKDIANICHVVVIIRIPISIATVVSRNVISKRFANHIKASQCGQNCRISIIVPVCATISYSKAFELVGIFREILSEPFSFIGLINSPGKIRNVDTSIRLTS